MLYSASCSLALLALGSLHATAFPLQSSGNNVCSSPGEGSIASYCLDSSVLPSDSTTPSHDIPSLIPSGTGLRTFVDKDYQDSPTLRLVSATNPSNPPLTNHIGEGTGINCHRKGKCDAWPIWDDRRINPSHACNLSLDPQTKRVTANCPNSIQYSMVPATTDDQEVWTVRTNNDLVVGSFTRVSGSSGDGKVRVDVTKPSGPDNKWNPSLLVDFAIATRSLGGFS
ncbi:MAG: hypothetical protein DHS80DRAFT_26072 [Piptocephalis tieghemiana]|nr:MAG: hypothetical protein DHS80DRAFT_26072 [Piptocephalis tieghemiana]